MQMFMQILGGASVPKIDAQVAISRFNYSERCLEKPRKYPYLIHVKLEVRAF